MGLVWILWIRGSRTSVVIPRPSGQFLKTNWLASCPYLRKGDLGLFALPFGRAGPSTASMISPVSIDGFWPSLLHWLILKIDSSLVDHLRKFRPSCGMKPKLWAIQTPNLLGPFWIRFHPKPFCRSEIDGNRWGSFPFTSWWTRARPSLKQPRRITTPRMRRPLKPLKAALAPPSVKPA